MSEPITRIWRSGFDTCWAELWLPRTPSSPPDPPVRIRSAKTPPDIDGYERAAIQISSTKWGARRKARRMKARYLEGLDPEHDTPAVEIVA